MFDPELVGEVPGAALALDGYRNQAPGFDPRSGEGARRFGGRVNPPQSFPVIYLCTTRRCVVAELTRQVERQGLSVDGLLPRDLYRVTASLTNVLDLTDATVLTALGLVADDLVADDRSVIRAIGKSAYEHEFQAIVSRSATGVDDVVAVLPENVTGTVLEAELVERWTRVSDLDR